MCPTLYCVGGEFTVLETLSDALNAAKKNRKVLSKTIIWESGVSKSQFYRIIQGKESPSPETRKRIADALGLDEEQFDLLHSRSSLVSTQADSASPAKGRGRLRYVAIAVFLLSLTALTAMSFQRQTIEPPVVNVALKDDKTLFIKDVTIPDGTAIPVNTEYVKTWRVKNVGNVPWKNRFLMRITPASKLLCSSPSMVPIPDTMPGETVDISVTFVTPHLPGSCRTDWKTADDRGNLYFPEMHGLYSIVVVTE